MKALSQWWKLIFYFISKALFVLKIFKFFCWTFGYVGKTVWLERWPYFQNWWRHKLINKTITIQILPNISQHKDNQTMKFGQFIEYSNKRNIFLQKPYRKLGWETSFKPYFVCLFFFFFFVEKALHEIKAGGLQLNFIILW